MSIPSTTAYYAPRGFAPLFGAIDVTGPLDALCDAYGLIANESVGAV